jgi:hypothetical protein
MTKSGAALGLALMLLGGCATEAPHVLQSQVGSDEVADYVQQNWTQFVDRARRFERRAETPVLVVVHGSKCRDSFGVSDCSIDVTVDYGTDRVRQTLGATFDRNEDGVLIEVIVSVHERAR